MANRMKTEIRGRDCSTTVEIFIVGIKENAGRGKMTGGLNQIEREAADRRGILSQDAKTLE